MASSLLDALFGTSTNVTLGSVDESINYVVYGTGTISNSQASQLINDWSLTLPSGWDSIRAMGIGPVSDVLIDGNYWDLNIMADQSTANQNDIYGSVSASLPASVGITSGTGSPVTGQGGAPLTGGAVVELTAAQVSTFLANHWGFWIDYNLGTVSPLGESVYDNTLQAYVFMFNTSNGPDLVMSLSPFNNENMYQAVAEVIGSSVVAIANGVQAAGNAALKTATQLPTILIVGIAVSGLYIVSQLTKKS